MGIAHTAPFSPWSFGYYLSRILPFLLIVLLFFIAFYSSEQERRVRTITNATPINQGKYLLIRCGAMIVGYLLISIITVSLGLIFYANLFQYMSFGDFILPAIITLLPMMLLILGIGLVVGEVNPAFLYVMMVVMFLLGFLPLPYWADFFGGSFFLNYPNEIGVMDPSFVIPIAVIASKFFFSLVGLVLILAVVQRKNKSHSVCWG